MHRPALPTISEWPSRAWVVDDAGAEREGPLRQSTARSRSPGPVRCGSQISCCGVCRTDLHLAEGDLAPRRPGVTPGHEVVGRVDALGPGVNRFALDARVGVPWLGGTDGTCRFCLRGDENLCLAPTFTGWDVDGGYADYCLVDAAYAYALPDDDRRRARRTAVVCRHHRVPRVADVEPAQRRRARHLRFRWQRTPGRPGGAARGRAGARHDARQPQPRTGRGARCALGRRVRRTVRPSRSTPRSCSLRPASSCRSRCAPSTAAARWRSPASTCRTSRARLRPRPVRGTRTAQRHREHARRRRAVPRARGHVRATGRHDRLSDERRTAGARRPGEPARSAVRRCCTTPAESDLPESSRIASSERDPEVRGFGPDPVAVTMTLSSDACRGGDVDWCHERRSPLACRHRHLRRRRGHLRARHADGASHDRDGARRFAITQVCVIRSFDR